VIHSLKTIQINTQHITTMAAKIEWQRHKNKTASTDEMLAHDDYLNDPTHIDHAGYTLMPGKNYNCPGPTREDLVAGVDLAHTNHIRRKKILKVRRRTPQLWGEAIFAFDVGCYATAEEREQIEREYIRRFFGDTAARAYWHVNEATGKCDLHIIYAHKRPCGKLTLERTTVKMEKRLQALDRFAADLLNSNPDKPVKRIPDIRTAEDVAEDDAQRYCEIRELEKAAELQGSKPKKKKPSKKTTTPPKKNSSAAQSRRLAAQVARKAEEEGIDDVEAHHLCGLLERLKIKILEIVGGIIKYQSSRTTRMGKARKPRTGIIRVHDFLLDVLNFQVDLRIERERALVMENPEPDPPIQPEPPIQSAPPEVASLPINIAKAKKSPAEKAILLKTYLEVVLGLTEVSIHKRIALIKATNGMLKSNGTITPSILKSLPPEQQQTLVALAAERAKEME
jgi:hypothetical protein